ncbi:MAG TPA: baseplate J/gp47 family protein, partial [Candidatus Caenarcaniphilales bacterium]|nr:baseplate J/gp47 family protein [Candidatus Caenarcaniphilales bacterium]
ATAGRPSAQQKGRRRLRLVPLLAGALLMVILAGAAYAAYLLVPTATISLRPHTQQLGPVEMTVVADPAVAVPDAAEGIVPAQTLELSVSVNGTFPATGTEVSQSRASGVVRFRSENTVFDVPVPAGTRVTTASGIAFETTRAVTLERASFEAGPSSADAPIRAVRPGPRGNVAAEAISRVPQSLSAALVSVRNPRPTSGGRREDTVVVTAEDYEAAFEALVQQLPAELQRVLADPSTTPRGLTTYPASARTAEPLADVAAVDLVGTAGEEFRLAVESSVTVLAVNEGLVDQAITERITAEVPVGATLHGDGITIQREPGSVVGNTIVYRAFASARTYTLPDREQLLTDVRGKSVSEARAIMERYGSVELTVWPEFVDRLPDQLSRINLIILPPQESA